MKEKSIFQLGACINFSCMQLIQVIQEIVYLMCKITFHHSKFSLLLLSARSQCSYLEVAVFIAESTCFQHLLEYQYLKDLLGAMKVIVNSDQMKFLKAKGIRLKRKEKIISNLGSSKIIGD